MTFSEKIAQLRREKGMSQEELAQVVGVSRQAVQKWESGQSNPDMDNLKLLSSYFDVTLDYLVCDNTSSGKSRGQTIQEERVWVTDRGSTRRRRWEYEYISKKKVGNLPLIHIHTGSGLCMAKGVIAIGNVALGYLSIGLFSLGLLSVGVLSAGIIAIALLGLGVVALGNICIGLFAAGNLAVGLFVIGNLARGVIAIGNAAFGEMVGIGNAPSGHLAMGFRPSGDITVQVSDLWQLDRTLVTHWVKDTYPDMWDWLVNLIAFWFHR